MTVDAAGDQIRQFAAGQLSAHVVMTDRDGVRDFMVSGQQAAMLADAIKSGKQLPLEITNVTLYPNGVGGGGVSYVSTPFGTERVGVQ